jgi:glycosyltransferase involved in cell wall biosynthesis
MSPGASMSIVATCFNQARFFVDCLESLAGQTDREWQLIITDDASTDDSRERIADWVEATGTEADLLFGDRNAGLPTVLNRALDLCTGDLLLHVGCDDILEPDRVALRRETAATVDADVAVISSDDSMIDPQGELIARSWMADNGHLPAADGDVFEPLLRANFVLGCSATYRRSAIEAIGGWDEALVFEDWDLLLRLAQQHRFRFVPGSISRYRIHPDSMMRTRYARVLRSRLDLLQKWAGLSRESNDYLVPYLQDRAWRLYRADPDMGRDPVRAAYADATSVQGRFRRSVATSGTLERACGAGGRVRQRMGPTRPGAASR